MSAPRVFVPTGHGLSFGGILRSEWIKLRSLRSTVWCFAIAVALTIGLGALLSATLRPQGTVTGPAGQSLAVQAVTIGIGISSLVVVVLGALVITGEYGTGMIRSTLAAVPTRIPALIAKVLVFGATTFVVGALSFAITVPISVALLAGNGVDVDLGDPAYWRALVGGVGYLAQIGMLSFAIGAIIRNSAGGIAAALGLVLVIPTVVQIFGAVTRLVWVQNLEAFLPSSAGARMYSYFPDGTPAASGAAIVLEPWQGALVLAIWVVALLVVAGALLKRRDA